MKRVGPAVALPCAELPVEVPAMLLLLLVLRGPGGGAAAGPGGAEPHPLKLLRPLLLLPVVGGHGRCRSMLAGCRRLRQARPRCRSKDAVPAGGLPRACRRQLHGVDVEGGQQAPHLLIRKCGALLGKQLAGHDGAAVPHPQLVWQAERHAWRGCCWQRPEWRVRLAAV